MFRLCKTADHGWVRRHVSESQKMEVRMKTTQKDGRILVIGGAHIDRRGRISGEVVPGASNPGHFITEPGGGAFNAARNLGLLGLTVHMISPRGGDADGEIVADAAAASNVVHHPIVFLDHPTPSYTAILSQAGNLVIALADMALYDRFGPSRIRSRTVREALSKADIVLCDANLPKPTLTALGEATRLNDQFLAAIAISPAKVVKLMDCLPSLNLLFMNEAEARVVAGADAAQPEDWPKLLRRAGLKAGAITRGERALIAFDEVHAFSLLPPPAETLVDVTGAGDAFAAGTLAALSTGQPLEQAIRHGAALSALTISTSSAVFTELTNARLETMVGLVPAAVLLA